MGYAEALCTKQSAQVPEAGNLQGSTAEGILNSKL